MKNLFIFFLPLKLLYKQFLYFYFIIPIHIWELQQKHLMGKFMFGGYNNTCFKTNILVALKII